MRIVLTVLAAVGVGGYAPGDYPCKGVAPNGRRWLFVMPQHTGTSVVASLLRESLHAHCRHYHTPVSARDLGPAEEASDTFVFLFAADPFKRVVTSATYNNVLYRKTFDDNFCAFKKHVCAAPGFGNETPVPGNSDGKRFGLIPPPMYAFLGQGVNATYVGRLSHLQQDLSRVLEILEYPPANLTKYHCISACHRHHSDQLENISTRVRAAVQNFSYMDYYDAESAACVERLYEQDFALFGFPKFDERPAPVAARSPVCSPGAPTPNALRMQQWRERHVPGGDKAR